MEGIAQGLWALAEKHEKEGCIAQSLKCLEAICQSHVSFLPTVEVKTRLWIASLLLRHSDNVTYARTHLERAQLLLKQIPTCFELKFRAHSLLTQCYQLVGSIASAKQSLKKGLELTVSAGTGESAQLWACNFHLHLAKALTIEDDYIGAVRALDSGLRTAKLIQQQQLEMVFVVAKLHVQLMHWEEPAVIEETIAQCDALFVEIPANLSRTHADLHIYKELLYLFYRLRACDYKEAQDHVALLDTLLRELEQSVVVSEPQTDPAQLQELQHQLEWLKMELQVPGVSQQRTADLHYHYGIVVGKLRQAEKQLQGGTSKLPVVEWIPKPAVLVLVDLMSVICSRPKGMFKDCTLRINSGLNLVNGELKMLGITMKISESDLQHWATYTGGVYLFLLMQLLENKAIIGLTQSDFVDAQKSLVQMLDWHRRFPTMLRGNKSNMQMLLGHYAQSLCCFHESALHFLQASKALDLIAPIYRVMDTYVGVRERTLVLFASGILQMKQQNLQEARTRLATGLKLTHKQLGNHQLVSQYLTVLGNLAIAMHDTTQACDILKSSFTLAKSLHDIPTQVTVLAELRALFQEMGEPGKEAEHAEAEAKKREDLERRFAEAQASPSHSYLVQLGLSR